MIKEELLSIGEFAKIANTTKRTIRFYDKNGILTPIQVNSKGYRYYEQKQVLDFQIILLLRKLGVSLNLIKVFLEDKKSLKKLFKEKQGLIKEEIMQLKYMHDSLNDYYSNLEKNGTLVFPEEKQIDSFEIYYMDKVGSYSDIDSYCEELLSNFIEIPENVITLTIFHDSDYRPKSSRMEIAVKIQKGLKISTDTDVEIKRRVVEGFKALTYMYNGAGATLSLFWKELEKYASLKNIELNKDIPNLEFYHTVSDKDYEQFFEIVQPIK